MRLERKEVKSERAEPVSPKFRKSLEKDIVVDSVEGGRKVEKDKGRDLLVIGSKKKVIVNAEERCFSLVEFSEAGLKDLNRREGG